MNECHLQRIVVEHASGFNMIKTINIKIPFDVGNSYGGFIPPLTHINLNFQIPSFSTINKKIGAILRNTTQNFIQQEYDSNYNIN